MRNYHDEQLLGEINSEIESGFIRVIEDESVILEKISINFPFSGSKIDWNQVPGAVEKFEPDPGAQLTSFCVFFDQIVAEYHLSGQVTYIGDFATEIAIEGDILVIRNILKTILSFPQHHYFLGNECSWCIACAMEGYMGFGFTDKSKR